MQDKKEPPPAVFIDQPEEELEERLRENPEDLDAKIDVGSDESMDASDPPSAARPDSADAVPSSGFDEDSESNP